jgi:hypothetical protein
MCIQCKNKFTKKLSELNHLSSSRKKNQLRFYEVVVSENRLVWNILNKVKYRSIIKIIVNEYENNNY